MEEGTFVTGLELLSHPPPIVHQATETTNKLKLEDKSQIPAIKVSTSNKVNKTAIGLSKSPQPQKNDSFPSIQHNRDSSVKVNAFRSTFTEQNFKKPLFKKLAIVKEMFDKTKSPQQGERKAPAYWNMKENGGKEYTHADAFNEKIVQKFDHLYQSHRGVFKTSAIENLPKKKHFFQEIEKQEVRVQGEQKKFNDAAFDIMRKEKVLQILTSQNADLERRLYDTAHLEEMLRTKEQESEEWFTKIELEEHNNRCLQHMKQLKKELLLSVQKKCLQKTRTYDMHIDGIGHYNKDTELSKTVYYKMKFLGKELRKKHGVKDNLIDPEFEDLLDNEISEFEERRNLREILKHEKVLEEELRHKQEEEERRIALAKQNKLREEENKRLLKEAEHEKELNRIKKQFNEFQKVTHVARKEQLIDYYDGLEERGVVLEKEIEGIDQDIKNKKEELKKLRENLKFKKFEEVEVSKDRFPIDIRLDDLEVIYRTKLNEGIEKENNIKRLEKLSYEVCTVISRILKQLQKSAVPTPVDQANVANLLSICGLKLERMLTVVIKKRKTFFIESINTDGTIKEGPPTYMNLISDDVYNKSRRRFEKEAGLEAVDEFEDGQLSEKRDLIKNRERYESPM